MWSKIVVAACAALSSLSIPGGNNNLRKTTEEAVIYWSPRTKLIGADFKKVPVDESHFSAGSHLGTGLEISAAGSALKFTIKAYFVPDKSWIKVNDADLLTHEQTHFDIEEYYARLTRKELKKIKTRGKNFDAIRVEADAIFEKILNEREVFQAKFDEETGHSVHVEKEKEWEHSIRKGLVETQEYASPDIYFTM